MSDCLVRLDRYMSGHTVWQRRYWDGPRWKTTYFARCVHGAKSPYGTLAEARRAIRWPSTFCKRCK